MALPQPPPLPPVPPIEIMTPDNRETVRRYGIIAHTYIRKVDGPWFITSTTDEDELYTIVRVSDLADECAVEPSSLVLWTEGMQTGDYDPAYPPIPVPSGKFRPGMRVLGKLRFENLPEMKLTIIDGPYLSRDRETGRPVIEYEVEHIYSSGGRERAFKMESDLREFPQNIQKRMARAARMRVKANSINRTRALIANKISAIRVPKTIKGQAQSSAFLGARAGANLRATVPGEVHLPLNITRKIANYMLPSNARVKNLRRSAALLGGDKPVMPVIGMQLQGGRKRTRRRHT
jgi:hypothetical protein